MKPEAADGDVERGQRPQHAHVIGRKPYFFVCLAQRGLIDRLARIDHAAGQRHLSTVTLERVGAHGQDDVRPIVERKREEQTGGAPDAGRIEARRPLAPGERRHALLRSGARQRPRQRRLQLVDEVREFQRVYVAPLRHGGHLRTARMRRRIR